MKRKSALILLSSLSVIVISSCSSSIVLTDAYKHHSISGESLDVVVLDGIQVDYSGDLRPEFGEGTPDELVPAFFNRESPKTVLSLSTFNSCSVDSQYNYAAFHDSNLVVNNFLVKYKVPSSTFDNNSKSRFLLVIDGLSISTKYDYSDGMMTVGPNGMMMGTGGSASKNLIFSSKFVIWDKVEKRPVSYGDVKTKANGFFPVITMNVWYDAISIFYGKIFRKSPFYKMPYDDTYNQ